MSNERTKTANYEPEYKCVQGHDLCHTMYPCKECPYCEIKFPEDGLDPGDREGAFRND